MVMVMVISGENGDDGEYGGVEIHSSGKIPCRIIITTAIIIVVIVIVIT